MYSGDSKIEKKVTFILAAAGQGKRMNMSLAKQFLEYKGEPLFYSSLKIAFENQYIDDIIIVTNKENIKNNTSINNKIDIFMRDSNTKT